MKKTCEYCGNIFESSKKNVKFCPECRQKHSPTVLWYRANRSKFKPRVCICPICGNAFETSNPRIVTCGDPECVKKQKRKRDSSREDTRWHDSKVNEYGSWQAWEERKKLNAQQRHAESVKRKALSRVVYSGVCVICGKSFDSYNPQQKTCSHECSKALSYSRREKRIPNRQVVDKDITLRKLYERDNGVCYLCGRKCDWSDKNTTKDGFVVCGNTYPSIDHVMPISRGGLHSWDNVRLACRACNIHKSNTVLTEKDKHSLVKNISPIKNEPYQKTDK